MSQRSQFKYSTHSANRRSVIGLDSKFIFEISSHLTCPQQSPELQQQRQLQNEGRTSTVYAIIQTKENTSVAQRYPGRQFRSTSSTAPEYLSRTHLRHATKSLIALVVPQIALSPSLSQSQSKTSDYNN